MSNNRSKSRATAGQGCTPVLSGASPIPESRTPETVVGSKGSSPSVPAHSTRSAGDGSRQSAIAYEPKLNVADAAKYLGLKPSTLNDWRTQNRGPVFLRLGSAIRYRVADLDAFLEQSTVRTRGSGEDDR